MNPRPTALEALGLLAQGVAAARSRRDPEHFWPLMTAGLVLAGCTAAPRAAAASWGWSWRWLGAALGLGAGLHLGVRMGARAASRLPWTAAHLERLRGGMGSAAVPTRAVLALPAALGEELFWRCDGWLGDSGPLPAAACRYSLAQLPGRNPLLVAGALPLGLATGWVKRRSGSLLPAVVCHLVFSELTLVWPGLPLPCGAPEATHP